jgi:hypothetical protein
MKVTHGSGNEITRDINEVFGSDEVALDEVLAEFAEILCYDTDEVDAHVDGCVMTLGMVTNNAVINLVPKAGRKG